MTKLRVALRFISSEIWQGGYNYLLNLCRVVETYKRPAIEMVLFAHDEAKSDDLQPFRELLDERVVLDKCFAPARMRRRQLRSICWGNDRTAAKVFAAQGIDVVFENADYYGWRFPIPAIAWMPDFQHRLLPHMFSKARYYRRELGFRLQVGSGRTLMVSSQDAKRDLQRFYAVSPNRIHAIPFALPVPCLPSPEELAHVRCRFELPERYFVCPNQFHPHKNHLGLARGVAELVRSGHPLTVVCPGGTGSAVGEAVLAEVKKYVAEHQLEPHFRLPGRVSSHELNCLVAGSQALINPSHFEGWSTTVEEAKAIALPLILSDIPVNREQTNNACIYFDPHSPEAFAQAIRRFEESSLDSRPSFSELEIQAASRLREFATRFESVVLSTAKQNARNSASM